MDRFQRHQTVKEFLIFFNKPLKSIRYLCFFLKNMQKSFLALFFLSVFTITVIAPTVIMMVDDSCDVSMLYSLAEEEENQEKEGDGKVELLFSEILTTSFTDSIAMEGSEYHYNYRKYATPALNLICNPPEFPAL